MSEILFTDKRIAVGHNDSGMGHASSASNHTGGVSAPPYPSTNTNKRISAVACWSGSAITGKIALSGTMLYYPWSINSDGSNVRTYTDNNYYQLGLADQDGNIYPLYTYTNAQMTSNNGGTYLGTKIERSWTAEIDVEGVTSLSLAFRVYQTGGPGKWTSCDANGVVTSAEYTAGGGGSLSVYVRDGDAIRQAVGAYTRVGNEIKPCAVYANVDGQIKSMGGS